MELLKKILWWALAVFLALVVIGLMIYIFYEFPELVDLILRPEKPKSFPAARQYRQALDDAEMTIEVNFRHLKSIGVTDEVQMTGEAVLTGESSVPAKQ